MSEDPLGELELQLVAAARRRSGPPSARPASQAQAISGVIAVALAGFAVIFALGAVVLLAGH